MRVAVVVEGWPGDPLLDPRAAAIEVGEAWRAAAPGDEAVAVPVGDGGPRSAEVWRGAEVTTCDGGVEAIERGGATWLLPADGDERWDPPCLAAALVALAARGARRVVIPVGDNEPTTDAAELWAGDAAALREALAGLELVALVGSVRPLLGFKGMSAALLDATPGDVAVALASSASEALWAERARLGDHLATRRALLGPARASELPGAGAAGGLAYCLAVLGASLLPAAQALAEEAGLAGAAEGANLVVAVVPELTPRTIDYGSVVPAAASAAHRGVPGVALSATVRVGRRDLMAAGLASAHEAAPGPAGLADGVRRLAHTWSR